MRSIFIFLTLITLWPVQLFSEETKTNAPATIPASQAKEYIGSEKTVTGTIAEVNQAEKLVRLNFDKRFPAQTFTAVIFSANTNLFSDLPKLKGKRVEITGKIVEYRDRPQIVLASRNQLKVIEVPKEDEKK